MNVHLIAVCGVGMSALAALLREAGHRVSGSDEHAYPPASTLLRDLGVTVASGWEPRRLDGVDLVICGNAVTRDNPEAAAAHAEGAQTALQHVVLLPDEGQEGSPPMALTPAGAFKVEDAITLRRGGNAATVVLTKHVDQGPGFELFEYVAVA